MSSEAKGLITPLLLIDGEDGDTLLKGLLYKALGEFQSRVGALQSVLIVESDAANGFAVSFSERDFILAIDRTGSPWPAYVDSGLIHIESDEECEWPIKAQYHVNLRALDFAEGIVPEDAIQVTLDYLKVLIDGPNLERVHASYENSQLSTEFLSTPADVRAEKEAIELRMTEMVNPLPAVLVFD